LRILVVYILFIIQYNSLICYALIPHIRTVSCARPRRSKVYLILYLLRDQFVRSKVIRKLANKLFFLTFCRLMMFYYYKVRVQPPNMKKQPASSNACSHSKREFTVSTYSHINIQYKVKTFKKFLYTCLSDSVTKRSFI